MNNYLFYIALFFLWFTLFNRDIEDQETKKYVTN